MKHDSPKTLAEVRERMVEIERKRAEDYKWLLDEVAKNIMEIAHNEATNVLRIKQNLMRTR